MSKNVITTAPDEPIESAAKKMEEHSISALPVVDADQHLIGLITSDAISIACREGKLMRILSIHASSMWYHATQKTKLAEPITVREDRMEECVVLFCCVEKLDEKNPDKVIASAHQNILHRLDKPQGQKSADLPLCPPDEHARVAPGRALYSQRTRRSAS